jgi:pulcherriminic acid synthase
MNRPGSVIREISIHEPGPRLDPLALQADPHRFWAHWRQQAPIAYWPDLGAWLVLTYDGVRQGLGDPRLRTDLYLDVRARPGPLSLEPGREFHSPASAALAEQLLEQLQSGALPMAPLERCCREIIQPLAGRPQLDTAAELAAPLAEHLVVRWLGMSRSRRLHLAWLLKAAARDGDAVRRRVARAMVRETFLTEIARSRKHGRHTLLGHLAGLWAEHGADDRDLAVLLAPVVLWLIQGTGVRYLVHAVHGVIEQPELQDAVRDGGVAVARKVAIEAARWLPVIEVAPRRAAEPVAMGGVTIPAHMSVFLVLAAACWDPAHHAAPERLELDRDEPSIALGRGWQACLGRRLAVEVIARALWIALDSLGPLRAARPPTWIHELGRACTALPVRTGYDGDREVI